MTKRSVVADIIRERVVSAKRFGTVDADGRLPSARVLAAEFDADPRVVVAAYLDLAREGLIERRPPSRAFFVVGHLGDSRATRTASARDDARPPNGHVNDTRPIEWLAGVLAQALERDIPVPAFPEWTWQATETLRLRAACLEDNRDHMTWLCRELQEDYGLDAVGLDVADLPSAADEDGGRAPGRSPEVLPLSLRRADLLVTTPEHAAVVRPLAAHLGRACIVVAHREDLTRDLERLLASGPVYFVGTDPRFAARIRTVYAGRADPAHVRPVILGEHEAGAAAAEIPPGAPAYVMRTARDQLGGVPPQVRALPSLRAFSRETRLELLRFVVERNLAAWSAQHDTWATDGGRPSEP